MDPELTVLLDALAERKGRFRPAAYAWVLRALESTRQRHQRAGHVSGRELAEGARDLAREEFGPMARLVLEHWGVRRSEDIGRIVYDLIEVEVLRRTEEDSLEDFRDVFDFEQAFERDYRWG